ncbi:MAG: GGDEF domain-containing response regulator [Desulfobaccales bacterium]
MTDEKILLADDEPQILELLTEFLEGQGYVVRSAVDGLQALDVLEKEEFTVALLDLKLPGHSGLELLSFIKARSPETEVILFTGNAELQSAVQALRLGAYDYLLKSDLLLADLQAVINRALERRRLTQTNRTLLENLSQAQAELALRRTSELTQIRRIGETLAGPLTGRQIAQGMLNLIWESLSLSVLGLEIRGNGEELPREAYRRQPEVADATLGAFKSWLKEQVSSWPPSWLEAADQEDQIEETPLPSVLRAPLQAGEVKGLVAAGREAPFTPEESELFRIFTLQGSAAFKNLMLYEKVRRLAIRDGLTGLYNYRYFWEVLHREVELARRYQRLLTLLFLDIDDFKKVNDTLGHRVGDLVLKALGTFLLEAVRHADLVCRYGGEEFVVLLSETGYEQALTSAERLRDGVSQIMVEVPEEKLQFTISIGVSELKPGMDGDDLVKAADIALYRAKQAGKNRICGF